MRYFLFAFLLFAAIFPNCKKEQITTKPYNPVDTIVPAEHVIGLGKNYVLKNGIAWSATAAAASNSAKNKFDFVVKHEYSNGLKETFGILDISLKMGKQTIEYATTFNDLINSIPNAAYSMSAYDEGIGNFYPDTTRAGNFIEILRFDTVANEVEGRYQVFLGKDSPSTISIVPDSVFLTEGKFYLKLK